MVGWVKPTLILNPQGDPQTCAKCSAYIFAAVLISAGLAAFVGSPAQAACPYTGCIDTNTKISAPDSVKVGKTAKIGVRVTSAGNAEPKGRVTVKVQRRNGGYSFIDSKKYSGGKVTFKRHQPAAEGQVPRDRDLQEEGRIALEQLVRDHHLQGEAPLSLRSNALASTPLPWVHGRGVACV